MQANVKLARKWAETDEYWGDPKATMVESHRIPITRFTPEQVEQMMAPDIAKLRSIAPSDIRGYVVGRLVTQHDKERLRPTFEPACNATCLKEQAVTLQYPSRLERRQKLKGKKFLLQFDYLAYFDEFGLPEGIQERLAIRTKDRLGRDAFYTVTRMPMGATWSVGSAQTVTWCVLEPLLRLRSVSVDTSIDNVRIAGDDPVEFLHAVKTFISRCRMVNAQLDNEYKGVSDDDLLQTAAKNAKGPFKFMGEETFIEGDEVFARNTENNLRKLAMAVERLKVGHGVLRRHVASIIGMLVFLVHVKNVPLCQLFRTLRFGAAVSKAADIDGWGQPLTFISPDVMQEIVNVTSYLLRNDPTKVPEYRAPASTNASYDTIILVDASSAAWAALIWHRGRTFRVTCGWQMPINRSAHAEPRAASRIFVV